MSLSYCSIQPIKQTSGSPVSTSSTLNLFFSYMPIRVPKALAKYVDVVNHPGIYIKAEIDKITQNVEAKVQGVLPKVVLFALLGLMGLFLLVFASLTLALFLNSVLDSSFYGFLIVTGLYLLIVVFLVLIRNNDSLQRKLFGLPPKERPTAPTSHQLEAPDTVRTNEYRAAREHTVTTNGRVTDPT